MELLEGETLAASANETGALPLDQALKHRRLRLPRRSTRRTAQASSIAT